MRILLTLTILFFTTIANAGLIVGNGISANSDSNFGMAEQLIKYNGAIIGYAQACDFPKKDYQMLEEKFFKALNQKNVYFNSVQMKNLKNSYEQAKSQTSKQKNSISKTECGLFEQEYKKIIESVRQS